jgi:DnaJ-class molecular chaperone
MLSINELPHKFFKRQGNNLCLTVDLKLYQALAGFTKVIEHLDGRKLYLSSTTRTDFNTVRKIPKEGMMGDLFIRFNIVFPEATSEYNLQLKTLLKLMEPEEVSKETLIRQGKPSEVTCLPCSITEQISAQRAFDRVEPVKPHQGHAFQPQAPLQPQCAQQ